MPKGNVKSGLKQVLGTNRAPKQKDETMAKKCIKWGRAKGKKVCRKFSGSKSTTKKGRCLKWGKKSGNKKRRCLKRAKR